MIKRIITETVNIKNKEFKITNVIYNKKIYLFGLLIYNHDYTSNQNDIENDDKNKVVGFKKK